MADGFIQLPGDSTGKSLDTADINMGVGSTSRHRERVVIADQASTGGFATVTTSAGLQVTISSGVVTATAQTPGTPFANVLLVARRRAEVSGRHYGTRL